MRILFWLLAPPILLFLCALTMLRLPLPQPFPPPLSGGRNLLSAIVTGLLGAGYIAALAVYLVSTFLRAGRVLDPALAALGLSAENYLLVGRQYHGAIEGRAVDVYFTPSRAVWPTQLEMYVQADMGTRLAIGRQRPLLDCRDCARLEGTGAEMAGLQVYAQEEDQARSLLNDAASRGALLRLLADQEAYGFREIYVQPERIWLRAHPREMGERQLRQWLADLLILAGTGGKALE